MDTNHWKEISCSWPGKMGRILFYPNHLQTVYNPLQNCNGSLPEREKKDNPKTHRGLDNTLHPPCQEWRPSRHTPTWKGLSSPQLNLWSSGIVSWLSKSPNTATAMIDWIGNLCFFLFGLKNHFNYWQFAFCFILLGCCKPWTWEAGSTEHSHSSYRTTWKLLTEQTQTFLPKTSRWDDGYVALSFPNLQINQNSTSHTTVWTQICRK